MPQRSGDDRTEATRQPRNETTREGQPADAEARPEGGRARGPERGHWLTKWFASTAVRAGLTLVGVVLLLFAVGRAVGLPLLEFIADALSSRTGRWLVVAFFALLLIGAAQRIGSAT